MRIDLSGHHVEITDSIRSYVQEKLEKLTRHFDRVTDIHVILSVEKQVQKAEASILVANNKLFASSTDENLYAAIDALADKLDRQILKHKEKIQSHRGAAPNAAAGE
ncbi:MAG: ribosome-associated translation inhibitor RaiA [Gammaproteobacteria bacterium]|nr:ribosome-associated translation inhibitor RaiA [Gammaproteobacteria bacterium]